MICICLCKIADPASGSATIHIAPAMIVSECYRLKYGSILTESLQKLCPLGMGLFKDDVWSNTCCPNIQ